MAIKRTSSNSISNAVKLSTGFASAAIPNSPTIGTATATSDVAATVTYTAAVLGATGSTFTATSNPGSVTGTGSSPITVTGLTASTSYTFSVTAGNANGTSAASSASNSITTSAPLSSYESIATVTVGAGGAANVEFTSIPATFKHLQIRALAKSTRTDSPIATYVVRFNADGSSIYSYHRLTGNGSAAGASGGGSNTDGYLYSMAASQTISSSTFGVAIFDILDYAANNKNKTLRFLGGSDGNSSGTGFLSLGSVGYFSTNAISSIKFSIDGGSNFTQYTQFALYGIKGA